jgi:hypothetical protein
MSRSEITAVLLMLAAVATLVLLIIARVSDPSPNRTSSPPDLARPKLIAVIAVAGFVCSLFLVPLPLAWHLGFGYAFYMALRSALGMVCMYGFWRMWRWSVYVYAALAMVDVFHFYMIRPREYGPPALEIVFALVGFMYVRKMQ